MEPLFAGDARPLPRRTGVTWTVTSADAPEPPPVRHASGYEPFVDLVERTGIAPSALFDLWTFARFIRERRDDLDDDPALLRAAVLFLGNVMISNHPECYWTNWGDELGIESPPGPLVEIRPGKFEWAEVQRSIRVGGTVPAILGADDARFREFQSVVDSWRPGAPLPSRRSMPIRPSTESG